MEQKFDGILVEVATRGKLIERVLVGEAADSVPEDFESTFSGQIIDENNDAMLEVEHLKLLLEKHLGSTLEETVVVATLGSADKRTKVEIFNVGLGVDTNFFLSRWRNEGEKPSYVLWPKEMYESQLVGDEEAEVPFQILEGEWG